MLTYNMDVTPESVWKRTTPSEAELAQPYYCTEAGVFYAQQHFSTARTDKESYLLFYTLRGAGLIEQGESHVVLSTGQALLLNCRTPQSYCTVYSSPASSRMERSSSVVMASTPQPKETSWMKAMSGWVQTYRAALYIRAW